MKNGSTLVCSVTWIALQPVFVAVPAGPYWPGQALPVSHGVPADATERHSSVAVVCTFPKLVL